METDEGKEDIGNVSTSKSVNNNIGESRPSQVSKTVEERRENNKTPPVVTIPSSSGTSPALNDKDKSGQNSGPAKPTPNSSNSPSPGNETPTSTKIKELSNKENKATNEGSDCDGDKEARVDLRNSDPVSLKKYSKFTNFHRFY